MAGASKYLTTVVFNQYFVGKPTKAVSGGTLDYRGRLC